MNLIQPVTQMDLMEHAGNMLDWHDAQDLSAPGLLEKTGVTQHGMPTASGLNDYDYQDLSKQLCRGQTQLSQLQTVKKVPIPPEVMEHFKHIKCHCMMGLFPEIGRAWLAIDSDIYIWTYEQTKDIAYFDGLSHLIVSVGLVAPKPGVFISDVKYLLIVTTPVEIVVLGVMFGNTSEIRTCPTRSFQSTTVYGEMQLMSKPIFILNTENVAITSIEGSLDGRIFLGGRDGFLYEIVYQAESSWFGKRCKKVNHSQGIISYMMPNFLKVFSDTDPVMKICIDSDRKLLFVLTEKGSIEAWYIGEDSNNMFRIAKMSQNEIAFQAENILKTVDSIVFKTIRSICCFSESDCPQLHLIAVTQCGVRFYFSTQQFFVAQQGLQAVSSSPMSSSNQHTGLYLMHVRLPPGYTPNTTSGKPRNVHTAFYKDGSMLLVSMPQPDQDILWSISAEPFPFRQYLAESTTVISLDGMVWDISEMKVKPSATLKTVLRKEQRKVVLLTNQGAHIIELLKPEDILQQLLFACGGPHHDAVRAYFDVQTPEQACATSLQLACMEKNRGTDIAEWAAQAFLLYGGEPRITGDMNLQSQQIGLANNQRNFSGISSPTTPSSPMFMSTPFQTRQMANIQQNLVHHTQYAPSPIASRTVQHQMDQQIVFSLKHKGLYLYVSRILRPIWKKRCLDSQLCTSVTQPDCTEILEDLHAVKEFIESRSVGNFYDGNSNSVNQSSMFEDPQNLAAQAQTEERRSLMALNALIRHSCEVIGLWKILCEHQFPLLNKQLTKEQKEVLLACTFRDLVLSRSDICAFLIVALINSYFNDNAGVGSISARLRNVCPNLYSHEDAIAHKATEIISAARLTQSPEEKSERLRSALYLCKEAAPNLPLSDICQEFVKAKFFQGVVELTATSAAKIDPKEVALHYYRNNEPSEDQDGFYAFSARMNCYKEVKQMLDVVYHELCSNVSNTGFSTLVNTTNSQESNANSLVMKIVSIAIQTSDPLLHIVVYDWLLTHNLLSELLALNEPTLGEFLKRSVLRNPDNLHLADLLWKFYERNGQHAAAAKILDNLASTQSSAISLVERIEYLARAVICMSQDSVGYSVHNGILLKDLEDKLVIARVQKYVLDALLTLEPTTSNDLGEAISKLNFDLYTMTELYSDFAEPFDLLECKLTILNASNHNDPLLIESVWAKILNKAVEGPGSSAEKRTRLMSKVHLLVKEFGESGHCFPLAFLVRELELKCCHLKLSPALVPDALVAMKLDLEILLDYYSRMILMNERVWSNGGNEWHLIQAAGQLIDNLCRSISQVNSRNRRRVIGKAEELIADCLNQLNAKPGKENEKQFFRELQIKLQRAVRSSCH